MKIVDCKYLIFKKFVPSKFSSAKANRLNINHFVTENTPPKTKT